MAGTGSSATEPPLSCGSHDTAICVVPPRSLWGTVDRLRSLYDKAYEKWPPHINLVYPFVKVDSLEQASARISSCLAASNEIRNGTFPVSLNAVGVFSHRHDNTVFVHDNDASRTSRLESLRNLVLEALGQRGSAYRMHLTIGQSEDISSAPHGFLLQKASLIPALNWDVQELCLLVRERTHIDGNSSSRMKVWATISLKDFSVHRMSPTAELYEGIRLKAPSDELQECITGNSDRTWPPFYYSAGAQAWKPHHTTVTEEERDTPENVRIASYNVLAEFEYPPSHLRYPLLLKNILDEAAVADVLVLQEVTDDFLIYLLQDGAIRREYPFVSHGPPDQEDIDPLPSHLNVVVLSKWSFSWKWISFRRKHKGSVVLQFDHLGKRVDDTFVPVILATVHLTCGLTDGSVAAKKIELQNIIKYLTEAYPHNPWILAGDFNITTSTYTIGAALQKKAISSQTAKYLANLETMLTESGLSDTWMIARLENLALMPSDDDHHLNLSDAFEGEEGATFNPVVNELAAAIVGSGFNNRPQRYDRILVKSAETFSISGFNMFGQHAGIADENPQEYSSSDQKIVHLGFASDHWGVRCSLKVSSERPQPSIEETTKPTVAMQLTPGPESLAKPSELRKCLADRNIIPSEIDMETREQALQLLEDVLLEDGSEATMYQNRLGQRFVIVPVGSYGLGVWTTSSDIDCLCIGPISTKTFFALARQRLRKASSRDVKLLRQVNANSGTMLELEVLGIKMDLQYCPSALIAETWPQAMKLPPSSPVFTLPTQTLAKLKPVRDLYYLRHTLPDLAAFRFAFHVIKAWAKQSGIYSARFGYLGGIHISILLSRVCKLLAKDGGSASVPSIITTFFHQYANFDWKNQMVFDPFFHKRLRYVRTSREPLAILGFHSPALNTAHTASLPSVRTISEELQRANQLLSTEGAQWSDFLGEKTSDGSAAFLKSFRSYIKIDVQFWGVSLDLHRRLPTIHARIWPARFVNVDQESSDEDKEYQGYYLVGLDQNDASSPAMSKEDLRIAFGSLQTALHKFETQLRSDEKYFDSKTSWMSASVVNQSQIGDLKLDHREWGEYTLGDDEEEDDEDEEILDATEDYSEADSSTSRKKKAIEKELPARPAYSGKFRSSADVINRIRWDPNMDSSDYIVGYEDRFLGIMERELDQWKAEQTDEEFIPQHRIMFFKRKSDAVVVWDRQSRRDHIFGSGVRDE
ncbi:hypothetical protein JX265_000211 [Neoarthrinium moseri]|uniref:polynucleotide adenylyltransferase n=1 Tax=Neoarthrinium moseri TaxID=1658444 RepID=A0A9Q0AWM4_9PEZI|nr:hypothetical protein JX265_000211 [Neoarthrinium moseri]